MYNIIIPYFTNITISHYIHDIQTFKTYDLNSYGSIHIVGPLTSLVDMITAYQRSLKPLNLNVYFSIRGPISNMNVIN